jgi:hypothetical protein
LLRPSLVGVSKKIDNKDKKNTRKHWKFREEIMITSACRIKFNPHIKKERILHYE